MPKKFESMAERIRVNSVLMTPEDEDFWCNNYDGTGCWFWLGARRRGYPSMCVRDNNDRGADGYGRIKTVSVHRLVLEIFRGLKIVNGKRVGAHLCNNTNCVNPMHIAYVTQRVNIGHKSEPRAVARREAMAGAIKGEGGYDE